MARLSFAGLDGIAQELTQMGEKADGVITEMLEAGGEEMVKAWQDAILAADLKKTGSMHDNTKAGDLKKNPDGGEIVIYPRGTDENGTSNALKAFVNHYGTSRIPATGFVDRAEDRGEETSAIIMAQIWESQD